MNAITTTTARAEPMTALIPTSLDEAARLAKIMSDMSLVPRHLQGKPADCMLVIEAAMRWRMSPFAVAQATSVVQGRLNYEGKLVAAALHTSGVLSSRLRYDYEGEGEGRAVVVSAMVAGEKEPRSLRIEFAKVRTDNKLWVTQPDQQLSYAGARIWGRRFAPEVMLGVYAPQEFDDEGEPEPEPEPKPVQSSVVPSKPYPERKLILALAPEPKPDRAQMVADRLRERMQGVDAALGIDGPEAALAAYNAIMGNEGLKAEWAKIRDERPELDAQMQDMASQSLNAIVEAQAATVDAPA
jgi:hypothetical protein